MSYFEIIMLVCFGAAWPFSIHKSIKSKSVEGKSLIFLIVLLVGYISGILHKIFFSLDAVVYLYILNLIMISIDISLFIKNSRFKKK